MLKEALKQFLQKSKAVALILAGTITWSLVMVRSGLCWNIGCTGGLGFWGANGHDGIWHLALINNFAAGNFQMPTFAGWGIQNYHLGFDLLLSWIVKLTGITPSFLYFQIIPPVLALLIGLLVYKFVYLWRKSEGESLLAVFFVYFGGSFGWLILLFRGQGWGGESMFWAQQSISTLINPPFALSLITILSGLIFLLKYLKNKSTVFLFLTIFFFGISIFIKVYAGLLVLSSILAGSVWQIVKKKGYSLLWIALLSIAVSVFLFIPFNKSSVGLILYSPFWFLETMMTLTDRFNWQKLFSAMTTYKMGHIWLKAILAYSLAFTIFMVGNFGTRIIAFRTLLKKPKTLLSAGPVEVFLFVMILAGIIVPTFFVQKGTPWNTIQFFYYSLVFSGIVAGIAVWNFVKRQPLLKRGLIIILFVLFTIPTTVASMGHYLPAKPQSMLPGGEVEALKFLSGQPRGVVLTYPYDAEKSAKAPAPRPLFLYTSTAYVSAFSGQPVFLEDQINLDIMQYPWSERRKSVEDFLNTFDIDMAKSFLKENNIAYVYWLKDQHARQGDAQLGLTRIFQNGEVTIFKVN
ncbi:MAG: hypothetical protein ACD_13C00248G0010 [uncultured bacterium]|nr:MAG: hypothetical protein ACD_13C00248G0010 [uncultured bacterium]KKR51748.1 MAG: hypothetical protein UT88_C0030G0003 [Candidatus Woesebacteria bacterium GW2011_GWD2_40_19]HAU65285.1 hypothetical protein [Candidatus Woesebacteria bacterium]